MNEWFVIRPVESEKKREAANRQNRYRSQDKTERLVKYETDAGPAGEVDELFEGKRPENFILYF